MVPRLHLLLWISLLNGRMMPRGVSHVFLPGLKSALRIFTLTVCHHLIEKWSKKVWRGSASVSGGWRRFSASWNYAWDNLVPADQQLSFSVASAHPSCSLVSTISKYNSARRLMSVWLAWLPLCLHVAAGRRTAAVIRHGGVTYAAVYGHPNILHITTFQPGEAEACCCLHFI